MKTSAHAYLRSGLCVLPADPKRKCPTLRWKHFQQTLPTEANIERWFSSANGCCLICGAVSGNLELLDFDANGEAFPEWSAKVEAEAPGLLARLVIERSQSGGKHVVYRCEEPICGNLKLAKSNGKTVIETRGEGGLFLCAPTPGYELLQNDLSNPPVLTEAERDVLLTSAWQREPNVTTTTGVIGETPGDDYSRRADIQPLLQKHGWQLDHADDGQTYWRRPGKAEGHSATLKDGVFYVFSSNAEPFEPGKGYSAFQVYALLEHNRDFNSAAAALRMEGYGQEAGEAEVDLTALLASFDTPAICIEVSTPQLPMPDAREDDAFYGNLARNTPGLISELVAYNLKRAVCPQPQLAFAGAIALQAALAGRKVRDWIQDGNRTNLYILSIADSGAGKELARSTNKTILANIGAEAMEVGGLTSDSALEAALVDNKTLLLQIDEFGRFLKTTTSASTNPYLYAIGRILMELYSSAHTVYLGKRYADAKKNRTIDQPCVVLHGTSTKDPVFASFTAESIADGFLARTLLFVGNDKPERVTFTQLAKRARANMPQSIIDAASAWQAFQAGGNLATEHPSPLLVEYDDDALVKLDELAAECTKAGDAASRWQVAIWARCVEKACRLALVYACSATGSGIANGEVPHVSKAAFEWGAAIAKRSTERLIAMADAHISLNAFDAIQKKALEGVRRAGGSMTQTQLTRLLQHVSVSDRAKVIDNLVETGQLVKVQNVRPEGSGRQGFVYTVAAL